MMNSAHLFTDRAERRCDPRLLDIMLDQVAAWNRGIAYVLSALVCFGLGFEAALTGF